MESGDLMDKVVEVLSGTTEPLPASQIFQLCSKHIYGCKITEFCEKLHNDERILRVTGVNDAPDALPRYILLRPDIQIAAVQLSEPSDSSVRKLENGMAILYATINQLSQHQKSTRLNWSDIRAAYRKQTHRALNSEELNLICGTVGLTRHDILETKLSFLKALDAKAQMLEFSNAIQMPDPEQDEFEYSLPMYHTGQSNVESQISDNGSSIVEMTVECEIEAENGITHDMIRMIVDENQPLASGDEEIGKPASNGMNKESGNSNKEEVQVAASLPEMTDIVPEQQAVPSSPVLLHEERNAIETTSSLSANNVAEPALVVAEEIQHSAESPKPSEQQIQSTVTSPGADSFITAPGICDSCSDLDYSTADQFDAASNPSTCGDSSFDDIELTFTENVTKKKSAEVTKIKTETTSHDTLSSSAVTVIEQAQKIKEEFRHAEDANTSPDEPMDCDSYETVVNEKYDDKPLEKLEISESVPVKCELQQIVEHTPIIPHVPADIVETSKVDHSDTGSCDTIVARVEYNKETSSDKPLNATALDEKKIVSSLSSPKKVVVKEPTSEELPTHHISSDQLQPISECHKRHASDAADEQENAEEEPKGMAVTPRRRHLLHRRISDCCSIV